MTPHKLFRNKKEGRSIQAIICYQSWGSNFHHWVWLCQCVMYFGHQWKEFWSVRWEWMIWYQMHSRDQWGRDPSNARMWKNIGIIGKFQKKTQISLENMKGNIFYFLSNSAILFYSSGWNHLWTWLIYLHMTWRLGRISNMWLNL